MNEQSQGENLITCIQITPYQDGDALYLQSNILIPVPGTEPYTIQIGNAESDRSNSTASGSAGIKAAKTRRRHQDDQVTHFVRKIEDKALLALPDQLKIDGNSKHARASGKTRWYQMWYSNRYPWGRSKLCYVIHVEPIANDSWRVVVNFETRKRYLRDSLGYPKDKIDAFKSFLTTLPRYVAQDTNAFLRSRDIVADGANALDDALVDATANSLKEMIETLTPKIEDFVSSHRADE